MYSGCRKSNSVALGLTEFFFLVFFFFPFSFLCWRCGKQRHVCAVAHVWMSEDRQPVRITSSLLPCEFWGRNSSH